ncbi:DUF417 family protein [Scandinavium manionii]|uniref:DUF417 family protein n=1 Tax=Scandinavium manionii TaxID=2926520 RepID=UPI00135C2E68|nr:DUF417 family protein [Scandinavium manionii]MCS2164036.1 YkgB family protein [Scandinavium manionii]
MKTHTHTLHRSAVRLLTGTDMIALRLSVIAIFALFGTYKWFAFEANSLHHLLPGTWLGALYPLLGVQGVSYALGVVENITLLALIAGFFVPLAGAVGAVMVIGTGAVTLSLLPQLGHIDSFIIKDVLLLGVGLTLLRHDLRRALVQRRLSRKEKSQTSSQPSLSASLSAMG